eukprot:gnl/Trimastix_PCT/2339.p1 GENE.gnl/Trimastix_PCT/2339~~gnl/Trimastix_PCT/2339.p1  ORF type:complete len:230 (+),score=41.95 gnl/Trimastix_PCT/2339:44-733(+)
MQTQEYETLDAVFQRFQEAAETEQKKRDEIRDRTREIDQSLRKIQSSFHRIHSQLNSLDTIYDSIQSFLPQLQEQFQQLHAAIPPGESYRYRDAFRRPTSQAAFIYLCMHWLKTARLMSLDDTRASLGLDLDLEEYLFALCSLCGELARLASNAVVAGALDLPARILPLISAVQLGFKQLNLRNNELRRASDALKYDVKRCEEVVYDLRIRGLVPSVAPGDAAEPSPST